MKKEGEMLARSFKRLIHLLTTGRKVPFDYGGVTLFRAEIHILELIAEKKRITATEIVAGLDVTKGAISQIVTKLVKKNLVNRSVRKDNLKVYELSLSEKGRDVLLFHQKHEKNLLDKVETLLGECKAEEIARFTEVVNAVCDFVK